MSAYKEGPSTYLHGVLYETMVALIPPVCSRRWGVSRSGVSLEAWDVMVDGMIRRDGYRAPQIR